MHVLQEFWFSFPAWGSHFNSCFIWKQPGLEAALRFCAAIAERKDDLSTQEARLGEFLSLCRKLDHLPDCFVEENTANCHLQSLTIVTSILQTPTLNFHCRKFRTGCDQPKFHPALGETASLDSSHHTAMVCSLRCLIIKILLFCTSASGIMYFIPLCFWKICCGHWPRLIHGWNVTCTKHCLPTVLCIQWPNHPPWNVTVSN